MLPGERTVKRLDAEFAGVLFEPSRAHQCNSAEPPHVGVVQSSTIIEIEPHRRIAELVSAKISIVDEKSPGESGLHDESIAGVQIQDYQLRPAPASDYCRVLKSLREQARAYFAQHVTLPNGNLFYRSPANRAVEIAGDRLRLR